MGLFLQTAIIPNCKEDDIKALVEKVEQNTEFELIAADCRYQDYGNGVNILFNDSCFGYEGLAEALSKDIEQPVLQLYIYDEDYWGYYLYKGGLEIDCFNPMPDYFEEVSEQERKRTIGNSAIISEYFDVQEDAIKNYLVLWTEERMDHYDKNAYANDEYCQCDCWQMVDFMRKLGFPYSW